MAGFETTDVAAKVVNPLQTIGTLATVQNAFNENKMFQAKSLAGNYLSQSLGPNGQPDPDKFSSMLQQDPRTAPYAPDILKDMQAVRTAGIGAVQAQQNLAKSQFQNIQNIDADAYTSASTAAQKANPTADPSTWDAIGQKASAQAIQRAVAAGLAPPEMAATYIGGGNLGRAGASGAAVISGQGGEGAQTAMTGKIEERQLGDRTVASVVNPYSGTAEVAQGSAGVLKRGPTPDTLLQRTPTLLPNNQPGSVSIGAAPTGPIATQAVPGAAEAQESSAKTSTDQYNAVNTAYNGSVARETLLHEMLAAQGDFKSGPGASKWSGWVTEANRILGTNYSPTATPSQQVFSKISEQLAAQQRAAIGMAPTDEQTQMSRLMNPNNEYSPEANKQVGAMLLGNEKMLQLEHAVQQDWTKRGGTPENYQSVVNQFKPVADPRIFQEMYMTPQQREQMYKNMTNDQIKSFNKKKAYIEAQMTKYGIEP